MNRERRPRNANAPNVSEGVFFLPSHVVKICRSETSGRKIEDFARWDLQAVDSLSPAAAELESRKRSRAARSRLSRPLTDVPGSDRTTLVEWADMISTREFESILSTLRSHNLSQSTFAEAVHDLARAFLGRIQARGTTVSRDPMPFLEEYVYEEIAGLLYFSVAKGINIEVYPGPDLKVLRDAANGANPDFPYPIPDRTHISVSLSPSRVRPAQAGDLPSLLDLVSQRPKHFVPAAIPLISKAFEGSKTLVWGEAGAISGFIIFAQKTNGLELEWMVVSESASGRGVGTDYYRLLLQMQLPRNGCSCSPPRLTL